jgi:NAD(P)-dependent dehydrogenase (short-subunit alcohol dehydrogenase family)
VSVLTGLRAIDTGGASGIGLATTQLLASNGAEVAVLDLDPSGVPEPLTGLRADVTDDTSVRLAVDAAVAALGGGLDILVNNAGIGAAGTVEDNPGCCRRPCPCRRTSACGARHAPSTVHHPPGRHAPEAGKAVPRLHERLGHQLVEDVRGPWTLHIIVIKPDVEH